MLNHEYEDMSKIIYHESIFKLENDNDNFLILENNQSSFPYDKDKKLDNYLINDCPLNKKTKNRNFFDKRKYSQNISLNEDKNENDLKRKDKLKRNAESARKSRARKKELMSNLIQENIKLKLEIKELRKFIENKICDECKKQIFGKIQEKKIESNNKKPNNKKKLFLFSTFTISLIILMFFSFIPTHKSNILRNLMYISEYSSEPKYTNLEIKNLTLASFHVLFGDYYSLVKRTNFLYNENNIIYSFKNQGKVRVLKEDEISEDLEPKDCKDCIVQLNQEDVYIKKTNSGKIQFKIIITPKINNQINNTILSYEIDCTGFSRNYIYQK